MDKDQLKYDENSYGGAETKRKTYKVKKQCNACGHIGYELTCPSCGGGMFKYKNRI